MLCRRFTGGARRMVLGLFVLASIQGFVGCERPSGPTPTGRGTAPDGGDSPRGGGASSGPKEAAPADSVYRFAAPRRLVAVGDVHGDFEAAKAALRLASVIGERGEWTGGETVVVQTGDQLDRGDGERQIIDLFSRLTREATAAGGAFIVLNGNHEYMNALGDFRYVTAEAMDDFDDMATPDGIARAAAAGVVPEAQKRLAAFAPGGAMATLLAVRPMAVIVGDSAFVHGGLLPKYAERFDAINDESRAWLAGDRSDPPTAVVDPEGPVWSRHYSDRPDAADCALLEEALAILRVRRMIVAHTVQRSGISEQCGGKVWLIDVGMSKHYGGRPEVLEIGPDGVNPMRGAHSGAAAPVN